MIRRLVARGLLSVVLAAALFSLFRLPAGAATVYQEITGMEELTSGQYVLVTLLGDAPGVLLGEDFVISATKPTFTGDTVAAGAEWNLTVTENRVILTDAHGVSAAPMEDDRNGIAAGTYEWQVLWDGEYFSFHGCNGSEPVTLVSDTLREYDFLACTAGGLGLHHEGACPHLQGQHRQQQRRHPGAGGTRLSNPFACPQRERAA